jgi:hypothetical protein
MTRDFRRRVFHESDSLGAPKYPFGAILNFCEKDAEIFATFECEYLREYSQTFEMALIQ